MFFVTGGTGYLGSALVAEILANGGSVRATVRSAAKAAILPDQVERVKRLEPPRDGMGKVDKHVRVGGQLEFVAHLPGEDARVAAKASHNALGQGPVVVLPGARVPGGVVEKTV